ncbi:MAG TPA: hypothetical protein VK869_09170 [Rubrobacteraceae bacterium]|nr:hypothetical protein [Rubrobacteraceae bacterium]
MPPAGKRDRSGRTRPRSAADDYRAKTEHEISVLSRRITNSGLPSPTGDPSSGIVIVIEQPVGPRVLQALERSLDAVRLAGAYVTCASTSTLAEEIFATEPHALVAVGPAAAREIDALDHPLAQNSFSEAETGVWFTWTKGTAGLALPPLASALDDDAAKRRFWRAFLTLRDLAPTT